MFNRDELETKKAKDAAAQRQDTELQRKALDLLVHSDRYGYAYQWTWLGLPIIQLPSDVLVTQEIIWATQPDLIIETGIAWGGSVLLYASLMELYGGGEVVGIDLNLYDHVEKSIMSYAFSRRIRLYKGSSTDPAIVRQVKEHVSAGRKVMVLLDSNHTHEHVLEELRIYAPLVTPGQYLIVSDTIVEDIPVQEHRVRPWGPGRNPKSALVEYLRETDRFVTDESIDAKILQSFNPMGYQRCVR